MKSERKEKSSKKKSSKLKNDRKKVSKKKKGDLKISKIMLTEEEKKEFDIMLRTILIPPSEAYYEKYKKMFFDIVLRSRADPIPPKVNINEIVGKMEYIPGMYIFSPTIHIGQRKLFISEIQFLTKYLSNYDDEAIILYIGAAPSIHTGYLSSFFPNVRFLLIDPGRFDVRGVAPKRFVKNKEGKWNIARIFENIREYSRESKDVRIFTLQDEFTNEMASDIATIKYEIDMPIYLISDVRTSLAKDWGYPSDLDLIFNLSQQYNWIRLIEPIAWMVKFRHPFYVDRDIEHFEDNYNKSPYRENFIVSRGLYNIDFVENYRNKRMIYLGGDINIQAWPPHMSSETRLTAGHISIVEHMNYLDYQDRLFYHNKIERGFGIHVNPDADEKIGFDYCGDCSLEWYVWNEYKKKYNNELVVNIIDNVKELSRVLEKPLLADAHGYLYEPVTPNKLRFLLSKEPEETRRIREGRTDEVEIPPQLEEGDYYEGE
jgi:hypothetical protein